MYMVSAKVQDILLILKNSTTFCISDKIPIGKVETNPKINKIGKYLDGTFVTFIEFSARNLDREADGS